MNGVLRPEDENCCKIPLCDDSHYEAKTEGVFEQGWIISSTCKANIYNFIQTNV